MTQKASRVHPFIALAFLVLGACLPPLDSVDCVDEVCDGEDNDCDGEVDESDALDASAFFMDADGDGFGLTESTTTACELPEGHAEQDGDCDDGDPDTYPGAEETWYDGVDQDCAGDDDYDQDTDGHQSADYGGDDCDDTQPTVHPGAFEYSDGLDNDCDGTTDHLVLSGAYAAFYGEADLDYLGVSLAGAGDVNGDGLDDLFLGAHGVDEAGSKAGAAYLFLGPAAEASSPADADAALIGEDEMDFAGMAVAGAGDVDADGHDDLLVGALYHSANQESAGAAYLVLGPAEGTIDLATANSIFYGEGSQDYAGTSVAGAGDLDGDGYADLLVGAPYFDASSEPNGLGNHGAAYVVTGPASASLTLSEATARLAGEAPEDYAGTALAGAGDVDGDGYADILVGAYAEDEGGTDAGAAYLWLGPVTGERSLTDAHAKLLGEQVDDLAGMAVAGAGDTDGDGHADILVGASREDSGGVDAGAAYLLLGPISGGTLTLASADAKLQGARGGDTACRVAGAGDVNGDGLDDVLVGAQAEDSGGTNAGAAYLLLGPVSGTLRLSSADAELRGETAGDDAGLAVNGAGDVDGDGFADILVGARYHDAGGEDRGAAYLLLGSAY